MSYSDLPHLKACDIIHAVMYIFHHPNHLCFLSCRYQSGKKMIYLPLLFVDELSNRVKDLMVLLLWFSTFSGFLAAAVVKMCIEC